MEQNNSLHTIIASMVAIFMSFTDALSRKLIAVEYLVRTEIDATLGPYFKQGAFAKIFQIGKPVPLEGQNVVCMNRDTYRSAAVLSLS